MAATYFPERYTNPEPSTETVGGIEVGSTFETESLKELFDALLYPFIAPAFTAFAIQGQSSTIEVGSSIAANRTFTWTTSTSANIESNSISIIDVTAGNVVIASGLADDGSEATTYGAITKTTPTTNQFKVQATDLESTVFSRTYTVTWQWMRYYGESSSSSLDEAGVEALRVSGLSSTAVGTYVFVGGGYKYIAFPGTLTSFKDAETQLNVPFEDADVVSVTNTYGQTVDYNVYRTTNIITSAITIIAA